MKKVFLPFCIFLFAAKSGFAADFSRGPQAVPPNTILISLGMAMGDAESVYSWGSGSTSVKKGLLGFMLAFDYALPFFGLTAGVELGYSMGSAFFMDVGIIPIMARAGYHPDLGTKNMDIYALFKVGFAIGSFFDEETDVGFGIGGGLGIRVFFSEKSGLFTELGYDSYFLNTDGYKITGRRFFTIGITYRL